jgi:hypothetical protein
MRLNLSKFLHVAAAGALMLALSTFDGLRGPDAALAREAFAVPGTFVSEIVVSNPGTTDASVTLTFVKSDGTAAMTAPVSLTVKAGSSVKTYVPNVQNLADGRYSVVVDSDKDVSAIVNLVSSSPSTSTSYNGIASSETGVSFNIASVYRNYFGFSSSIVVQNAGTSTANVTITYKSQTGATVASETRTIFKDASVTVDQTSTSGMPDGFVGSAVVTSDQPVAAIVLISASGQLSSARGFKAGAPVLFMPVIYNQYFNFNTNVLVQNVGTTPTNVKIEYYNASNGAKIGEEQTTTPIAAGSSFTFFQFDTGRGNAIPRPGFNGAAVVRSLDGGSIVAVANVQETKQNYLEAYNGFPAATATTKATCASILKNYFNYNTSLTVQNADTAATNLTLTFMNGAGQVVATRTVTGLQPGATFFDYNPNIAELPNGFAGAVVITSSGGKIAAIVNELLGAGDVSGDQLFTYACSNSTP